jgi:putative protease
MRAKGQERRVELMAPAGGPDAAFAALQYGADAVYLGLRQFSARADAENFEPGQLDELVAFAHSLKPRRRVYVAMNTVILDREVPGVVDAVARAADLGADALIVQDAGLAGIVQRHFPELRLHASTQMAVHNRAGVERLRDLGFARATLARELTLDEIRDLASVEGIEVETFVHGALCYCYSGLCLYSSLATGRSGNRGRCAYLCRDRFAAGGAAEDGEGAFRFSMKDLALPGAVADLAEAGVASIKIEGRKKNPLYVAAVTNFYRRLLDGPVAPADRRAMEQDIQSIFSRPWTGLFTEGRDAEGVVDPDFVGHRGTPVGRVEAVVRRSGRMLLRFATSRPVERHDGIQVDVPGADRPFGFPVDHLFLAPEDRTPPREVFESHSGDRIEVELPADAPELPEGATVYSASSQDVKRRYRFERPKPGLHRVRRKVDVTVSLDAEGLSATARLAPRHPGESGVEASASVAEPLSPARNPHGTADAVARAFEKLGDTRLAAGRLSIEDPAGLFAPASRLNDLRRQLAAAVEEAWARSIEARAAAARDDLAPAPPAVATDDPGVSEFWRIKIDRPDLVDAFEPDDLGSLGEVIFDIGFSAPDRVGADVGRVAERVGRDRVRIALPAITRAWDEPGLRACVERLLRDGWTRWEISNPSGWRFLAAEGLDLCGGWPLYATNRAGVRQWTEWGLTSVTLSPEDGRDNMADVLAGAADLADVPLYEDVPLFISETRACAIDRDLAPSTCGRTCEVPLVSSKGDETLQLCRCGRTVLLHRAPLCRAGRLDDLRSLGARRFRAAFAWRRYEPAEVVALWRSLRAGRAPDPHTLGNYDRGLA